MWDTASLIKEGIWRIGNEKVQSLILTKQIDEMSDENTAKI